jgi:predicted lipoprotein with Yx(FWY)xxD motif
MGIAAIGLAACGGGGNDNATAAPAAAAAKTHAVAVKTISGQRVLALRGHAIYSPSQEKSGTIKCTGGCAAVWVPVKASSGKGSTVGHLGSVTRPGGKKQLTYKKRPLYTFAPEGKGKLTGDGLKDKFGSNSFTWHVVRVGKKPAASKPAPAPPSNNYGY